MATANYRRRRVLALLALAIALGAAAFAAMSSGSRSAGENHPGKLVLLADDGRQLAELDLQALLAQPAGDTQQLRRAVTNALPPSQSVRRGRATITYSYDRRRAVADAMALRSTGGIVTVAATPLSSTIEAPVEKQLLRNNCEATALKILLATLDVRAGQLKLQQQMRTDGPLDPVSSATGPVWGDPNVGFVGRADGGGVAGGFGAYPPPIIALARRYGVTLRSSNVDSYAKVTQRLLSGRAVIVWLGLGSGPFKSWKTRSGKPIEVNLNEHTVVLTGISRSGEISYVDPLVGARGTWTRSEFEPMWELLDRRAVST